MLLPTFNFKTGKREYKDHYMQLGKRDILVIEGIHGLNEKMSESLPKESKFKIYIKCLDPVKYRRAQPALDDRRQIDPPYRKGCQNQRHQRKRDHCYVGFCAPW